MTPWELPQHCFDLTHTGITVLHFQSSDCQCYEHDPSDCSQLKVAMETVIIINIVVVGMQHSPACRAGQLVLQPTASS